MPDIIGFADVQFGGRRYVTAVARHAHERVAPGRALLFPVPNGPDKVRTFSVIDPRGQLVYRAASGRIAQVTNRRLSGGVCSCRLAQPPPAWTVRKTGTAWHDLKRRARKALRHEAARAVLRTDVRSYYATIDAARLSDLLLGMRCDPSAVDVVVGFLAHWRREHLVRGLPIGPEGSGVLGTAFLHPVDESLAGSSLGYFRYTDDIFIVGHSHAECWDFADAVAADLAALGVEQNTGKTQVLDAADALETWFSRSPLGDYDELDDAGSLTATGALAIVREQLASGDLDASRFAYALGALRHLKVRDARGELLAHDLALEQFPKAIADYLIETGPVGDLLVGTMIDALRTYSTPRSHARDLHLLRACRHERMGRVEGRALARAAGDEQRPEPVRAWALDIAAQTGCLTLAEVGDLALDTACAPLVRRAAVACTRRFTRGARGRLLAHPQLRSSRLVWTASWAAAQ